jgi:hypothetical protein
MPKPNPPEQKSLWNRFLHHPATPLLFSLAMAILTIIGGGLYLQHLGRAEHNDDMHTNELIDAKLKPIGESLSTHGEKLAKIEGQLEVLLAFKGISDSTRHAKSGKISVAIQDAKDAHVALIAATTAKIPAPPEYFEDTAKNVGELANHTGLSQIAHTLRIALAEYRSAITPKPSLPERVEQLPRPVPYTFTLTIPAAYPVLTTVIFEPPKPVTIEGGGAAFDARGMRPDQEIFVAATRSLEENPAIIKDLILIGATQTLDYISWGNVTFVGTHIKSQGGPARLANVRFVNCTFDLPNDNAGVQIAQYAALQPKQTIRVG